MDLLRPTAAAPCAGFDGGGRIVGGHVAKTQLTWMLLAGESMTGVPLRFPVLPKQRTRELGGSQRGPDCRWRYLQLTGVAHCSAENERTEWVAPCVSQGATHSPGR